MSEKLTEKEIAELDRYAGLEGAEIGDYLIDLIDVRGYSGPHGMGGDFSEVLNDELTNWLEWFRRETKIVTTHEPRPDLIIEELVYSNQ